MGRLGVCATLLAVVAPALGAAGPQTAAPLSRLATPEDAVTAIIDAFQSHSVVALGEGPHGNEQGHAFRLALVRDPRFAATVNDILVEFGSGRYQALMDRFTRGEEVPADELRHVWQDTTIAGATWDRPIYEEFFRAVRTLNLSLPPERRVRVLLGDAPIEWERVSTRAELRKWGMEKDGYAGRLVKHEVLAKKRRVLVIYGDGHLQGRGFAPRSLINVLEAPPAATKVFAISSSFADLASMQPDVASWPVPSLARIQSTVIGEKPYGLFYPPPPAKGWNTVRLQDQFDAVLYLGSQRRTTSRLPPALCADAAYMAMRRRRMALDDIHIAKANLDALEMYCTGQVPK